MPDAPSTDWFGCGFLSTGHVFPIALAKNLFELLPKAYIIYRDQHARIRQLVQKADVELIARYLQRRGWQARENSNMAYSL